VVIGIKTYKASLKVTIRTSTGEVFDERVDIVLDADSKEEAKARLENLHASVELDDIRITSVHHVGRGVKLA
jgi:uncharacterized phosphosugar-binding protein